MAVYTKEQIADFVADIRKYNGRVASFEDWAELLEVTDEEFINILLQGMSTQEAEEVVRATQEIGEAQENQKNLVSLCYPTDDVLGRRGYKGGFIAKFIDPLSSNTLITEGRFRPRAYDILYVVQSEEDVKILKKFLIEGVMVKGRNIFLEAIKVKEIQIGNATALEGVERYILSLA